MTGEILRQTALDRLRNIQRLSREVNGLAGTPHDQRLLDMMRHHAEEIQELFKTKDAHYLTEVGDLWVLCCEILLEAGAPVDATLERCLGRFEKKLTELIRETRSNI